MLELSVVDFGGTLDASKISIDDTEYHAEANNIIEIVEPRHTQKQELLDLEKLLNETLPTKYPNLVTLENVPDTDLPSSSAELGNQPDPAAVPPVVTSGL